MRDSNFININENGRQNRQQGKYIMNSMNNANIYPNYPPNSLDMSQYYNQRLSNNSNNYSIMNQSNPQMNPNFSSKNYSN